MTVQISKPAINLREELASMRSLAGGRSEKKFHVDTLENGDFSAGTAGWTAYNYKASVSASNGELTVTATGTGNGSFAYQRIATKVGKTYKVTATIVSTSAAYVRANINTIHPWTYDGAMSFTGTANVTKEFTFVASQDHIFLGLGTNNTTVGNSATYSSITMQEIGENLVTNGTFDSDRGWVNFDSGATISGGVLNLNGTPNADACRQNINIVEGKTYHLSWEIKSISGGSSPSIGLKLGGSTEHTASTVGVHTATAVATSTGNVQVYVTGNPVGTVDNIIVTEGSHPVIQSIPHGYDVQDVYIDGELAREGEAYDYQVQTDGISQWLKPAVEPTASTETVVIGVPK